MVKVLGQDPITLERERERVAAGTGNGDDQWAVAAADRRRRENETPISVALGAAAQSITGKNNGKSAKLTPLELLYPNLFSAKVEDGVATLKAHLATVPAEEHYGILEPLIRKHWKWFCLAAPHLDFPEPKPIADGEKIRLALRIHVLSHGGAERVVQLLANHFAAKENFHVTIFIDSSQHGSIDYALHPAVELVPVDAPIDWRKQMEDHPQDLIICPQYWEIENYRDILLLKLLGARILAEEHGGPRRPAPFERRDEKNKHCAAIYSICDGLRCLTNDELDQWRADGLENCTCLANPVIFNAENTKRAPLNGKTILWIGRFASSHKRPEMAIRAFAKVLKKIPDARLVMAGECGGIYAKCCRDCKNLIRRLRIGHAVQIHEFQKDLTPYYSSGDLLLCSSSIEGYLCAATEAKAFGVPILSTSMPYLTTLRRGAVTVPPDDENALAAEAVKLLLDRDRLKKLGDEARKDSIENFSDSVVFGRYDAFVEAIFRGNGAVREYCAAGPQPGEMKSAA
ncbi:MAG: glycosyltransferase [Puniceicoccales bacterium]|nr:glycosyltransferase [Puniceicoccales bacterium]